MQTFYAACWWRGERFDLLSQGLKQGRVATEIIGPVAGQPAAALLAEGPPQSPDEADVALV